MHSPEDIAAPISQRDNLFGVCHALGEDFGFNPIYPRVALALLLLVNPEAMLIIYVAAGIVVLTSRLLTRRRATPRKVETPNLIAVAPTDTSINRKQDVELACAA